MIIEFEDRFCKAAQQFSELLQTIEQAARKDEPAHRVEELLWTRLLELGRRLLIAYIQQQDEKLPRPGTIRHNGKKLQRLSKRRTRSYLSVFGRVPFRRDVYATREAQRQEVVPLDAKLGMPEGDVSYLLQKWSGSRCVNESYQQSRAGLLEILGFAPSVNCLEDTVANAAEHVEVYFDEQEPVDPQTEAEILVVTSDCKGVPVRAIDAPQSSRKRDEPAASSSSRDDGKPSRSSRKREGGETSRPKRKRLKKGEKNGRKRMACVGGVYSVEPFPRTPDEVLDEMLREKKQVDRPRPCNKRLRAVLSRQRGEETINAKEVVFDWLASEARQRDARRRRRLVAIMDGEEKLRDLQENKLGWAIGILDIWHATEYLWTLAYCFHREGSDEAEMFVETYLRKLLEGKVGRAIGGIRQMATKRGLPKPRREKVERCLRYFEERREYMKYDEYLAAGYPIGSGVVEGACRHLVKDRMEGTGMRWRLDGAQAVLSLRAIHVNGDWEAFHASRIAAEQAKIYPYKCDLPVFLNSAA
jgi:hypothetical protein